MKGDQIMEKENKPKLSEEALELRRKYLRDWRKKNLDKTRKYRDNYWEKKAAEMRAASGQE